MNGNQREYIHSESLDMPNIVEISPGRFSGGLWTHSVNFQLEVTHTTNRFIHYQITDQDKPISWLGTFLYGYPNYNHQNTSRHKYLSFLM